MNENQHTTHITDIERRLSRESLIYLSLASSELQQPCCLKRQSGTQVLATGVALPECKLCVPNKLGEWPSCCNFFCRSPGIGKVTRHLRFSPNFHVEWFIPWKSSWESCGSMLPIDKCLSSIATGEVAFLQLPFHPLCVTCHSYTSLSMSSSYFRPTGHKSDSSSKWKNQQCCSSYESGR